MSSVLVTGIQNLISYYTETRHLLENNWRKNVLIYYISDKERVISIPDFFYAIRIEDYGKNQKIRHFLIPPITETWYEININKHPELMVIYKKLKKELKNDFVCKL